MFPIQMTLNVQNAAQLAAINAAITGTPVAETKAADKPKADTAKKSDAATATADTKSTVAATGAQDTKAASSEAKVMTADERGAVVKEAIAKSGRDAVVALLAEFGVKKAGEIEDAAKLAQFDAKLQALAK